MLTSQTISAIQERRLQYHVGDEVWRDAILDGFIDVAPMSRAAINAGAPPLFINRYIIVLKNVDNDEIVSACTIPVDQIPQVVLNQLDELYPYTPVTMIDPDFIRVPGLNADEN